MKTITEDWQVYKKHGKFWRIALGCPAMKHSVICDDGSWELWFNLGDLGIWWRR